MGIVGVTNGAYGQKDGSESWSKVRHKLIRNHALLNGQPSKAQLDLLHVLSKFSPPIGGD
jgi:hypothetical protein